MAVATVYGGVGMGVNTGRFQILDRLDGQLKGAGQTDHVVMGGGVAGCQADLG